MQREKLLIKGGRPLEGTISVFGAKNGASKIMLASLLTEEEVVIENVPFSGEIRLTKELCQNIGSDVYLDENGHSCRMRTAEIKNALIPELSRRNRIPVLALGPLLHRRGFAEIPVPGGCPIGHRPINFHIEALSKMGIKLERRENSYYAEAEKIRGAEISLPYPSVGATENIILTAALADGKTTINNAAIEPEIEDLAGMINSMGANISFDAAGRKIKINGVGRLGGTKWRVMPDRNEIVSFAAAALATEGDLFIENIEGRYLKSFLEKIGELGGDCEEKNGGIRFKGKKPYSAVAAETSPHPGFMTDWQQPFCVLLTQAKGKSVIHETIYEDRFGYAKDLKKMGASIELSDKCLTAPCRFHNKTFVHSAVISGPTALCGKEITMTDIRAGMAHIIAALAADGESLISGVEHIDRGYEKIDERLKGIGAEIKRI